MKYLKCVTQSKYVDCSVVDEVLEVYKVFTSDIKIATK